MSEKNEGGTPAAKGKPGFLRRLFIGVDDEPRSDEARSDEPRSDGSPPVETGGPAARTLPGAGHPARGEAPPEGFAPARADAVPAADEASRAGIIAPGIVAPEARLPQAGAFGAPSRPAASMPASTAAEAPAAGDGTGAKPSWWSRLREGMSRSSSSITAGIGAIFIKRKLDAAMLEDLEDVLIRADLGIAMATRISEAVGRGRYDRDVSPGDVKAILADEIERVLEPYAVPIETDARKPFVILVVGVNGSGKTTTIGKLAAKFTGEGKRVVLAAGDTFRAAAIAQLRVWGERMGCAVVAREQGSDAAGLAYEAVVEARAAEADILLMDTAGRLQNRTELMAELEKIIRVMRKLDPAAPHAVLLVLDATVGQNAMNQVEIFGKVAGVTGLVMTKLDGTARGGILVAITETFRLPVHFIGVGETADDLEPFAARDFAEAIAGIDKD